MQNSKLHFLYLLLVSLPPHPVLSPTCAFLASSVYMGQTERTLPTANKLLARHQSFAVAFPKVQSCLVTTWGNKTQPFEKLPHLNTRSALLPGLENRLAEPNKARSQAHFEVEEQVSVGEGAVKRLSHIIIKEGADSRQPYSLKTLICNLSLCQTIRRKLQKGTKPQFCQKKKRGEGGFPAK